MLSFRLKKRTSKNVADTTFKEKESWYKVTDNEKDAADKGFDYRKRESNNYKVPSRNSPSDQARGVRYEELMGLLGDEWMEDINFDVDDCCSDVNDPIISRRDNPPSETMSKASIVDKYLNRSVHVESLIEVISDLANKLNKMSIKMDQNS